MLSREATNTNFIVPFSLPLPRSANIKKKLLQNISNAKQKKMCPTGNPVSYQTTSNS
jgi:hypothetical protein